MAIVYKITNSLNDKSYIGYTRHSIEDRWNQHVRSAFKCTGNRKFYNALVKYGVTVWKKEILVEVNDVNEAKTQEINFISKFDTYNNGYNATKGGDGNNGIIMTTESNLARSKKLKDVPKNYNRMLGKKHTDSAKQKISVAHKGMKKPWVKWSPEQCAKRGKTRRSLSHDQYLLIHNLNKQGFTVKNIADQTTISYDLVKKWLKMDW